MRVLSKVILLFLAFCAQLYPIYAQKKVAGYLGKRTFFGASINYMPNIFSLSNGLVDVNYRNKQRFYVFHPMKYGVSAGYVLSNINSIQLDFETQRMGVLDKQHPILPYTYDNADFVYARTNINSIKLKFQGANQHCAPIGTYIGLTAGFLSFNTSYQKLDGSFVDLKRYSDFSFGYNGGIRRVFQDKFMLDLSVEGNVHIKLLGAAALPEGSLENNIIKHSIRKNGLNNIFTCKAALYYLL